MLDEERKLQEEENRRKREYLQKRYALLLEIASESSSVAEIEEDKNEDRVNEWIENGLTAGQIAGDQDPIPEQLRLNVNPQPPPPNSMPPICNQFGRPKPARCEAVPLSAPRMFPTLATERYSNIPAHQPQTFLPQHQVVHSRTQRPNMSHQLDREPRIAN